MPGPVLRPKIRASPPTVLDDWLAGVLPKLDHAGVGRIMHEPPLVYSHRDQPRGF